mmetsp:Transcript_102586/g.285707  ORF Transcript_102586/g.285707 Transcript_102586/m.285707 type:complete len:303 (+) Transcript_102586:96-1004(+)
MAYMVTPSVVLSFGGRSVEVPSFSAFAELQEKAEAEFDLHPNSYDFFDVCGKVELSALQRVVRMAGDGPCQLELRERPEWKKLRELEARIEDVASRQTAASSTSQPTTETAEAGVVTQVESALSHLLAGLADVETKVNCSLAPLVQSMALSQIDIKAKLGSIDEIVLASRLDSLQEQIASLRAAPAAQQDIPACKLDLGLGHESDVWLKHRQLAQTRGGRPTPSAEVWRPGSGAGAEGRAKSMRPAFGDVREALEVLPGVSSSPKAWSRAWKPLDHERGAGHRMLDRKLTASRSSPTLPPVF